MVTFSHFVYLFRQDIHVKDLPKRADTMLKVLSHVGCSLSIIGLVVTMAMYLSDK